MEDDTTPTFRRDLRFHGAAELLFEVLPALLAALKNWFPLNRTDQPPQRSGHVPSMAATPMAAHELRSKLTNLVFRTLRPSSSGAMTPRRVQ
ncbi:hypothetical protein EYF80_047709 [Liparis tanakae]|uniref:Uncharacterized protein n=1 Tax=Liparis tanakae TaxID=230148 RepID=A0A4Z2FMQ5_9TELE|nr:hypothetical protein EYF80_047709 [Liparis tanakae]